MNNVLEGKRIPGGRGRGRKPKRAMMGSEIVSSILCYCKSLIYALCTSFNYFTEQTWRAGFSTTDRKPSPEQMQNLNVDVREEIQRELEKERIREEIKVEEVARRRVLEEEVRRELMVEREIAAIRRPLTAEGLSSEELLMKERIREEIIVADTARLRVLEAEVRRELMVEREIAAMRRLTATGLSLEESLKLDIKSPSEINKDELISQAKPKSNLSGSEKEVVAVKPSAGSPIELPTIGLQKGPKEEWSCALCEVSAPNERSLVVHFRGKKHRAKEKELITRFPNEEWNCALCQVNTTNEKNLAEHFRGKKHKAKKSELTTHFPNEEWSCALCQISTPNKRNLSQHLRGKNHKAKETEFIARFLKEEWNCAICQISTTNERGLDEHLRGKKHKAKETRLGT